MEKSKVISGVMSETSNRKFITALAVLTSKTWIVIMNQTIDGLITAGTITSTSDLADDVSATMTAIKGDIITECTPAP